MRTTGENNIGGSELDVPTQLDTLSLGTLGQTAFGDAKAAYEGCRVQANPTVAAMFGGAMQRNQQTARESTRPALQAQPATSLYSQRTLSPVAAERPAHPNPSPYSAVPAATSAGTANWESNPFTGNESEGARDDDGCIYGALVDAMRPREGTFDLIPIHIHELSLTSVGKKDTELGTGQFGSVMKGIYQSNLTQNRPVQVAIKMMKPSEPIPDIVVCFTLSLYIDMLFPCKLVSSRLQLAHSGTSLIVGFNKNLLQK